MIETHCGSRADHQAFLERPELVHAWQLEQYLAEQNHGRPEWYLSGYCRACERPSEFLVDRLWGGQLVQSVWIPAWRERIECLTCKLNNRQRLAASHLREALAARGPGARVYLTEAITLFGQWAAEHITDAEVIGSEYLPDEKARAYLPPHLTDTRHEDVTELSFETTAST